MEWGLAFGSSKEMEVNPEGEWVKFEDVTRLLGPTVRQVFEKAYGPVPEGTSCYLGCRYDRSGDAPRYLPTIWGVFGSDIVWRLMYRAGDMWYGSKQEMSPIGPDYADRPATELLGWWPEYDAALEEMRV